MNKEILTTKLTNFLVKVVAIIFFILMGLNTLLVLTKTAIFPKDYQETLYYKNDNTILNIIFLIIFSIVVLILTKYLKKIISVKRLVLVIMIYAFIISILFAILRRDYVQFDPFNVIDQANNFIRENYSGLDKGNNYLYIYSHQITTVFVFQVILSLFGRATFILYIMQSFSISFIIFMLYKISNILFNDEDTNYLVVILSAICFPLIFYVAFVYGILPGMFLTLLAYYYFIKYTQKKKWYMLVVSLFTINLAMLFIGNNLIHMLAIFAIAVIYFLKNKDVKIIAFIFSCLFLMSASKSIISNYYEVKSQKEISPGVNKITWIAMGMQEGDREAGWWNRFNYDIMPEEDYNGDRIKEISINSIKQRLNVFRDNPKYMVDFYKRKYENQFIEPTFQSLLVTAPQRNFDNETKLEKVKDFFVKQIYFNETHSVVNFVMKVFQIFVYVFSFVFAVIMYRRKKELLTLIPTAFIGGTIFHMIWEAKSRYVFPYFVFLIPLAAYGLVIVRNKIKSYKKEKEEQNEKSTI
ncbi:membrane protein [Gemella cuniculi]|uniref:membrane protein n=1 Tax=Gemella cuniculi TaxID=150240 RepID=UPI0004076A21|nr:membrane protein [Gemella cuniculi]